MASKYDPIQGLHVKSSFHKSIYKGEDTWVQKPGAALSSVGATLDVFGVFDGHGGKQAAAFCAKHLLSHLEAALQKQLSLDDTHTIHPPKELEDCDVLTPNIWSTWKEQEALTACLPLALKSAFDSLQSAFFEQAKVSGTTGTVICLAGWQLVVANVGDSCAYLDTGNEVLQVSGNHRLDDNHAEQERIRSQGFELSSSKIEGRPTGPLRVWPGGLAMGRSLGDFEAGDIVMSTPEVRQVTLPEQGGRIVIASDGLWDAVSAKTALHHVRGTPASKAARELVQLALKSRDLKDDVTVIVVDATPSQDHKTPPLLTKDGAGRLQAEYTIISPVNVYHPLEDGAVGQEAWRRMMWERRLAAVKVTHPAAFRNPQSAEDLLSGSLSETHLDSDDEKFATRNDAQSRSAGGVQDSNFGQTEAEAEGDDLGAGEWSKVPEKTKAVPVNSRKLPRAEDSHTGATPAPKAMREAPLSPPPGFGPAPGMSSSKESSFPGRSRGRGRSRGQYHGRNRRPREPQAAQQSIGGFEVAEGSSFMPPNSAPAQYSDHSHLNSLEGASENFTFVEGGGFEMQSSSHASAATQNAFGDAQSFAGPKSDQRPQRRRYHRGRGPSRRGRHPSSGMQRSQGE